MKPTMWHVTVGILLTAYFFAGAGIIVYLLYGPGIDVKVPDFLLTLNGGTSTQMVSEATTSPAPLAEFSGALFTCEGDKALKIEFFAERIHLVLSDGRQLSLPRISSIGSGIRYANTDESFVFWSDGVAAFVEEAGVQTYHGCSAARPY